MCSKFRCGKCLHGVLTGILPNGVMEYACCKSNDLGPYFYYNINPERVEDCIDYTPVKSRAIPVNPKDLGIAGSYYEFD